MDRPFYRNVGQKETEKDSKKKQEKDRKQAREKA